MAGSSRSQGAGAGNFAWTVPLSALPGDDPARLDDDLAGFRQSAQHPRRAGTGRRVRADWSGLAAAMACRRRAVWRAVRWELGLLGRRVALLCVLPSPGVFRWSFRWLPLFHLVLALAGGRALSLVLLSTRVDGWPAQPVALSRGGTRVRGPMRPSRRCGS